MTKPSPRRSRKPWPAIVFCLAAAAILLARHFEAPANARFAAQPETHLTAP